MKPPSKANDFLRTAGIIAAVFLIQSCSAVSSGVRIDRAADPGEFPRPVLPVDRRTVITGKVKIDFPEFRVRGSCRIVSEPGEKVRIDFIHSSLFGSYREDATVYIDSGGIIIHDHERELVWPADSTLALLIRQTDFDVRPDDLLYVLLLAIPEMAGGGNAGAQRENGAWRRTGVWRGRDIELSGDREHGTLLFRQCLKDISACYTARYEYGNGRRYPDKIVLERDPGGERVSLTVSRVEEEGLTEE